MRLFQFSIKNSWIHSSVQSLTDISVTGANGSLIPQFEVDKARTRSGCAFFKLEYYGSTFSLFSSANCNNDFFKCLLEIFTVCAVMFSICLKFDYILSFVVCDIVFVGVACIVSCIELLLCVMYNWLYTQNILHTLFVLLFCISHII